MEHNKELLQVLFQNSSTNGRAADYTARGGRLRPGASPRDLDYNPLDTYKQAFGV